MTDQEATQEPAGAPNGAGVGAGAVGAENGAQGLTEAESDAWDALWDTTAARCCDCPACNSYLPHDPAEAARLGIPAYDPEATCELRAAVESILREHAERAWDEGYRSGHSNAMRRMSDEPNAPTSPNPYRAARQEQADDLIGGETDG